MKVSKKIGKAEWKDFFRKQFKNKDIDKGNEKTIRKERTEGIGVKEEWSEADKEEKDNQKIKKEKIALDKIPTEAWIFGGEKLNEKMVSYVEKI